MKKSAISILFSCLFFMTGLHMVYSQGSINITERGYFDKLYDRFGNAYDYYYLSTTSSKPLGPNNNNVNSVPNQSCQAGYFILYYAPGSYLAGSAAAQSVVCQVFTDLSNLISVPLPLSSPTSSVKIHIYCGDLTGGGLAKASSFYLFPLNPTNPNQGIIYSQVEKAMISGNDPFLNFPAAVFPGSNNFYSGYLDINPVVSTTTNPTSAWNTNMATLAINSVDFDLYSAVLHEAVHLLGFASLIDDNGNSKLGQANNWFTRYDKFLCDPSGTPLLSSSTPSCYNTNITSISTTSALVNSGNCTVQIDASNNCTSTVQYISPTNTVSVFTPSCYSSLSSLSHFEDMCSGNYTGSCTPTPTAPGYNNLYFVMSNSVGLGSCFVKRYLKQEERNVLCDLGYSLNTNYSSSALIDAASPTVTIHSYSSSCSPTMTIFGQNDGLTNNVYTFTTTSTTTNIPYSTLLANDFPSSGLTVSCLEMIYSTATFTQGSSDFSVTASVGSGLVLLKYLPENSSGQLGNPCYIYVYFIIPGCTPSNNCNIIENGGFENQSSGFCGSINNLPPIITLDCWRYYNIGDNPLLVVRNCTNNANYFNLGTSVFNYTPVMDSYNSASAINDRVVALWRYMPFNINSVMQNNLTNPLIPGQSYQLSFWALNLSASPPSTLINVNNQPLVISIASYPSYPILTPTLNFPSGTNSLIDFTINPSQTWSQITTTFVVPTSYSLNQNCFLIGINPIQTGSINNGPSTVNFYCLIDDINIQTLPTPSLTLPSNTICTSQTYTNLGQYFSTTATFTGSSVTFNNNQYNFNYPPSLGAGVYPLSISYSTNSGCNYTVTNAITISTLSLLNSTATCLDNSSFNLNSILTNTAYIGNGTFSVNGLPNTSNITFTAAGIYTIGFTNTLTTNVVCNNLPAYSTVTVFAYPTALSVLDGTNSVNSLTICNGNVYTLTAISSGTNISWNPGNLIGSTQVLTPTASMVYTITASNTSVCPVSFSLAVNIGTNCCNGVLIPTIALSSLSTSSLVQGPLLLSNNMTVQAGGAFQIGGELKIASNVKITIENGGEMYLDGAHLLSCGTDMWEGIQVKDGGLFETNQSSTSNYDNLIEDAKIAVDFTSTNTAITSTLFIYNTTFNKNHIGIRIR